MFSLLIYLKVKLIPGITWTKKNFDHLGYPNADENVIKKYISTVQVYNKSFKLFDEVSEVVKVLYNMNQKLSIVTTIPEFRFDTLIRSIRKYFTNVVTGANAICVKGNPKMYNFDLKSKNILAQKNLFVGDDLYYDIEIPKRLGQTTIHINRDSKLAKIEFADYKIKSLIELIDIVSELL